MKNEIIYKKWTDFINDPKYKNYIKQIIIFIVIFTREYIINGLNL